MDYEYQYRNERNNIDRPRGDSHPDDYRLGALLGPVGTRHGKTQVKNNVRDQKVVQDMVSNLRVEYGGIRRANGSLELTLPLPIEGRCDSYLFGIILRIQNTFHRRGELGVAPDGVIDPGGRTERLILAYAGADERPHPDVDALALAFQAVPLATMWAAGAMPYLTQYANWRNARDFYNFNTNAANVHLHFDTFDKIEYKSRHLEWIQNYSMILNVLGRAKELFRRATVEETTEAKNSNKDWGYIVPAWARPQEAIWFGPDMEGLGIKCRAAILLHEAGHYIRAKIGHQGGESGPDYDRQTADQALTSAYVCANFATHAATGRDDRFGLARPLE